MSLRQNLAAASRHGFAASTIDIQARAHRRVSLRWERFDAVGGTEGAGGSEGKRTHWVLPWVLRSPGCCAGVLSSQVPLNAVHGARDGPAVYKLPAGCTRVYLVPKGRAACSLDWLLSRRTHAGCRISRPGADADRPGRCRSHDPSPACRAPWRSHIYTQPHVRGPLCRQGLCFNVTQC